MAEAPVVAIWKENWLPASQTFVANQVAATRRWRPVLVGVRKVPDGLPVVPDLAPFDSSSLRSRAAHRARALAGYRGVYDDFLRDAGARVVHAHFAPSAMSVLPIARRLDLPLAVTFHGFDVNTLPRAARGGEDYRRRLAQLFDEAAALIAVSHFIAERLERLGAPADKIHVLPIGIPVLPRAEPPSEPRGVSFVGRLTEAKGTIDLVRAVGALPDDLRAATPVTVAGWGSLADEVSELAARLGVDVSLVGRRTPEEVVRDLAASRVFCAPSKRGRGGSQEALGLVFLEAAMQGLPVVAYRHGGVPEAVDHGVTGLLAEEGDVAGLTTHLERLLRDPGLARRMGEAGRDRVVREFDVVTRTEILERLYDRLAG